MLVALEIRRELILLQESSFGIKKEPVKLWNLEVVQSSFHAIRAVHAAQQQSKTIGLGLEQAGAAEDNAAAQAVGTGVKHEGKDDEARFISFGVFDVLEQVFSAGARSNHACETGGQKNCDKNVT